MMKLVVLSSLLAAASAGLISGISPLAYTSPLAYSSAIALNAPLASNYRGPLSLAPGQPASIIAADGRPLDTLDVNLDRSAHLTAQALNGGYHLLKKRSASWVSPVSALTIPASPLVAHAPLAYSAPVISSISHISSPITHW